MIAFVVTLLAGRHAIFQSSVSSLNQASWKAARLRRVPAARHATTLQIRRACGSPVETWGKSKGRWARLKR